MWPSSAALEEGARWPAVRTADEPDSGKDGVERSGTEPPGRLTALRRGRRTDEPGWCSGEELEEGSEVVEDVVGTGGGKGGAVGVAEGDSAGEGARAEAHPDIDGHIAYDQGFLGPEAGLAEGVEDRVGVGFGAGDVVGPEDEAEPLGKAHFLKESVEG